MYLYHGSNVAINKPKIIDNKRSLDFGKGFYLTSDIDQAKKWAIMTTNRRKKGVPTVTVFEFNKNSEVKMLEFQTADKQWLNFVAENRKLKFQKRKYDVIIGPVANDNTMPVINLYLAGRYNQEEALKRLLPQKLKDQYVFKTKKSLNYLVKKDVIKYE